MWVFVAVDGVVLVVVAVVKTVAAVTQCEIRSGGQSLPYILLVSPGKCVGGQCGPGNCAAAT